MLDRILARFSGPFGPWGLAFVALVLSMRATWLGFQADDHALLVAHEIFGAEPWNLWSSPPAEIAAQRDAGFWVWWSSPRLTLSFLRPLSSLSHSLDFALFPHQPWLMSLINILIYVCIVMVAGLLYRRLLMTAMLGSLAGLMFALDESHAISVGWISGRNTLLACLFSLCALLFHIDARLFGRRGLQRLSIACVAAALLSAEAGLWSLGYLVAYAAVLEEEPWSQRLRSILPQLVVGLVWAGFYLAGGYGLRGATWYRELSRPLELLSQGILDLPLWAVSLFGPGVVGASITAPPETARLVALPFAAVALGVLSVALKTSKETRFFALATLLCVVPMFTTLPQDRLTLGASFGALGWIACFVHEARASASRTLRWARRGLLTIHVWLALLLFPLSLGVALPIEKGGRALLAALPAVPRLVLLNAPVELLHGQVLAVLALPGQRVPLPDEFHLLYSGESALIVTRPDARTLELTASQGWGRVPVERIFSALAELPRSGEQRTATGMTARVLASTRDGRPARVRFTFTSALEDSSRRFLYWRSRKALPWKPIAIGDQTLIDSRGVLRGLPP